MKILFFLNLFLNVFLYSQDVQLIDCQLQYSKDPIKTVKKNYYPAKEIIINSQKKIMYRYRLAIDVKNITNKPIEAIVFRYSLSIKTKKNASSDEGVWTVPYQIDEIRISKLLSLQTKRIYVYDLNLSSQISKYKAGNFQIEALKIEIMKEPKKEDNKPEILTYIFPVKEI